MTQNACRRIYICRKSGKNFNSCLGRLMIHGDGRKEVTQAHNHKRISNIGRLVTFKDRLRVAAASEDGSLNLIYSRIERE